MKHTVGDLSTTRYYLLHSKLYFCLQAFFWFLEFSWLWVSDAKEAYVVDSGGWTMIMLTENNHLSLDAIN